MDQVGYLALGAVVAGLVGWFREWVGEGRAAAAAARVVLAELEDNEERRSGSPLPSGLREPSAAAWRNLASTISLRADADTIRAIQAAHHCFELIARRSVSASLAEAEFHQVTEDALEANLAEARAALEPLSRWRVLRRG